MKEVSVYFLAPMWSTAVQITANPPAAHLQSSVPVYFIAGEFGPITPAFSSSSTVNLPTITASFSTSGFGPGFGGVV
jgi:hypothetical protein